MQIFAKCNVLHMSEEAKPSVMGTNEGQNPYLVLPVVNSIPALLALLAMRCLMVYSELDIHTLSAN